MSHTAFLGGSSMTGATLILDSCWLQTSSSCGRHKSCSHGTASLSSRILDVSIHGSRGSCCCCYSLPVLRPGATRPSTSGAICPAERLVSRARDPADKAEAAVAGAAQQLALVRIVGTAARGNLACRRYLIQVWWRQQMLTLWWLTWWA